MGENRHTKQDLQQLQALPLKLKIRLTQQRIREWVNEYGVDGVYVSFSGGKDSTVLLHIARQMYPEIKAAFSNTGIEFPEIVMFVNTFSNVDVVRPKMPFVEVVKKYGYPMISKEVSECVSGARKYLNSVIEEQNSKLERSEQRCIYCGELLGKKGCLGMCNKHYIQYKRWGDPLHADKKERATIDGYYRDGKTGRREHRVIWEIGRYGKQFRSARKQESEGAEKSDDSHCLRESSLLKMLLMQDFGKTIDNLRVQRMMGINRKDGKATMETIPSTVDRSAFSCVRYQYFLDAPFEISNQCCRIMKKDPFKRYSKETGRHPITAQMASESRLRTQIWLKQGCNAFDTTKPISNPMSPWTENDVLLYIRNFEKEMIEWRNEEFKKKYGCYPEESEFPFSITSPIASVYGEVLTDDEESKQMSLADFMDFELFDLGAPCLHTTGCIRTGCITCLYGYHHETTKEKSRIQNIIDFSNPKMADWMLRGGHFRESDGLWEPYQGLGYWFIMEWCNKWGNMKYWYPNREYYIEKYSTPETRKWLE